MVQALGPRNTRVVEAARLHRSRHRRANGLTLIEGPNLLEEALGAGTSPIEVFALESDARTADLLAVTHSEAVVVDEAALARLAGTKTPRGPVAIIEVPASQTWVRPNVLVSWGVSDPGNVGALIRVAAAFGWDFGHGSGSADPWSPKTLRAGAGAHFRLAIGEVASLETLSSTGYTTLASVVTEGVDPSSVGPIERLALLIGEEANGLPQTVLDSADRLVTIPMPGGFESLNAAVAAGVLVHALTNSGGMGRAGV
jgi:RNA methyltransferase, TrmH family